MQGGRLRHREPGKPRQSSPFTKGGLFGSAALASLNPDPGNMPRPSHPLPIPPAPPPTGAHIHLCALGLEVPLPLLHSQVLTTQLKNSPFLKTPRWVLTALTWPCPRPPGPGVLALSPPAAPAASPSLRVGAQVCWANECPLPPSGPPALGWR